MENNNRKPRILLLSFVFSPNIGGVETHLDDLCNALSEDGYSITVITYQPIVGNIHAPSYEKKGNFEIKRIPWIKNLFFRLEKFTFLQILYLVPGIFFYTALYLFRNHKKIDIIQVHGFNMAIVGFLLSKLFRKPFVVNTHVSFYFNKTSLYAKILSTILNGSKSILVLTKEAQKELIKIGVNRQKIILHHHWIDTKLFLPINKEVARKKYEFSKNDFIVLFIGRLIPAKGLTLILEAARNVKKRILFAIAGSGEMRSTILKKASTISSIRFIGEIPFGEREKLAFLYSAADLCILPSYQATSKYAEGIPRVIIEALSCGIPLIATKTGGVGEVINGKIGFFVKPNSGEIVRLVNELSTKRQELLKMKEVCIAYAKKEFDKETNIKIIEKSLE